MASKFVFQNGKKVVTSADYQQQLKEGKVADLAAPAGALSKAPGFSPIGIGKPLLLELLSVYSGKLKTGLFGNRDDILVTSAVKSNIGSAEVQPLAINLLKQDVSANELFAPGALTKGSPVIYYSPGLTDPTVFFSFQAITDSFNDAMIEQLSQLMTSAGALPVFAPASEYLLVGGALLKIFDRLGETLLETDPFLNVSEGFYFDTAGVNPPQPENMIVHDDADDSEFHSAVTTVEQDGGDIFVAVNGERYAGPAPYAIVNVDGKSRPDLAGFAPTMATTALLNQFYGSKSKPSAVIGTVQQALSLYNDYSYYAKAKDLETQLASYKEGSPQYQKALDLLTGYAANITDPQFKITVPKAKAKVVADKAT